MLVKTSRLFGDTSELRTIQFLLPVSDLRFNISELARETRISRQTMMRVVAKLTKWNVLKIAGRHGGANYYALNQDSGFIKAFEDLDNLIIEQMGCEDKAKIAKSNCVRPPHPKGMGYASGRTHARLAGDQKSSSFLCPDSFDLQNCDSAFGFL